MEHHIRDHVDADRALEKIGRWWRAYERFHWHARRLRQRTEARSVAHLGDLLASRDQLPGHRAQILVELALDGGRDAGALLEAYEPGDADMVVFLDVARREWSYHRPQQRP